MRKLHLVLLLLLTGGRVLAQAPTFSPAPGTYSGPVSVSVTCAAGQTGSYTLDGSDPIIASTQYTSPITISTATTLRAICANIQSQSQNTQTSMGNVPAKLPGYKCVVPPPGKTYGALVCEGGGGVATTLPSNVSLTFGAVQNYSMSTTASTGETQSLIPYFGPGCDACDHEAQDFYFQPIGGPSVIANNEVDMIRYDHTRGVDMQIGLQCNQQPGANRWEVDSGHEGWRDTGVHGAANACPTPTTSYTHIGLTAHWTNGSTGCGGNECIVYDTLYINGVPHDLTFMGNHPVATTTNRTIVGNQGQIDLTNTTTSGQNPTTGGRLVKLNNVAASIGPPSSITTGSYAISGSLPTATPCTFSPAGGTYPGTQTVTLASNGMMFYTLDGTAPTMVSTRYTGPITVSSSQTIRCIAAVLGFQQLNAQNNNPSIPATTFWKNADCASFTGWSGTTAYAIGAQVSSAGFNWTATAASTNKTPASNPSFWSKYSTCTADDPGGTGVSNVNPTETSGNAVPSLSGASMLFAMTSQTSHQTNTLWPVSSKFGACNGCTYFLEDHYYFWNSSNSSSNEDDSYQFNSTSGIRYMAGMQYCFGSGCPGGSTGWDYGGNSNVAWTPTGVSDGGTLSTWHHMQRLIHRVPAEETTLPCVASGNWPFIYFDALVIDSNLHTNSGGPWKFCANALPAGWAAGAGMQAQIDIASHPSPTTSSVYWDFINYYALYDPTTPTAASYTITAGFTPPLKLSGTVIVQGKMNLQ